MSEKPRGFEAFVFSIDECPFLSFLAYYGFRRNTQPPSRSVRQLSRHPINPETGSSRLPWTLCTHLENKLLVFLLAILVESRLYYSATPDKVMFVPVHAMMAYGDVQVCRCICPVTQVGLRADLDVLENRTCYTLLVIEPQFVSFPAPSLVNLQATISRFREVNGQQMSVNMEHWWNYSDRRHRNTESEICFTVTLSQLIPHVCSWDRTRTSAMRNRQTTASEQPKISQCEPKWGSLAQTLANIDQTVRNKDVLFVLCIS
jgi:hypothetical protein